MIFWFEMAILEYKMNTKISIEFRGIMLISSIFVRIIGASGVGIKMLFEI